MNNLLEISGRLGAQKNTNVGAPIPKFNKNILLSQASVVAHKTVLEGILKDPIFDVINGVLLSIEYTEVIAKSNRVRSLFRMTYKDDLNNCIRGAKYSYEDLQQTHIFTYYLKRQAIQKAIARLSVVESLFERYSIEEIDYNEYEDLKKKYTDKARVMSCSELMQTLSDLSYIKRFSIDRSFMASEDAEIISFYQTDVDLRELLLSLGLGHVELHNGVTAYLRPDEQAKIQAKIPYLVSMKVRDLREICSSNAERLFTDTSRYIDKPKDEPVVGVIDTLFDKNVYFKDWVDYRSMIDEDCPTSLDTHLDYEHGTNISSLIVDGPSLNPFLEDNCGRFRVRHFGVCGAKAYSSFSIIKKIEEIVKSNPDIKVWNFSLGTETEVEKNSISVEASLLDQLQIEHDVIFVVSGTNDDGYTQSKRLGAPADSINSLVVNAVNLAKEPASYCRQGPVLSFFRKPDISYFGGDSDRKLNCCGPLGLTKVAGTSFAAAWISRKVAYLVYKMGFSKELAKALLIDSALGWDGNPSIKKGYGVVPVKIEDVIQSKDDEIRFVVNAVSSEYETYTYNLPVPVFNQKHPFFARATLCYFTPCSRYQGVDYTSTELDLHIGRMALRKKDKDKNTSQIYIKTIDSNLQGEAGIYNLSEGRVREQFRKWDNVKVVREELTGRPQGKKAYGQGLWGLSVKSKERLKNYKNNDIAFTIVVTLKEIHGKNRIADFIKLCSYQGWYVESIDIKSRLDIYNQASEEVVFI